MRVSQWQNIAWIADALVLGVVVLAGIQFRQVTSANAPPTPRWRPASTGEAAAPRWPGERSAFDHIHATPIGGREPAAPAAAPERPPVDRIQAFRDGLSYLGGVEFPDSPEESLAFVRFDGKEMWLRPGDAVGASAFRLIEFTIVRRSSSDAVAPVDAPRIARLAFADPDGGEDVFVEQPDPQSHRLVAPAGPPLISPLDDTPAVRRGRVSETDRLDRPPYRKPNGDWVITDEAQLWIEVWGERHVVPNLGMRPVADAEGRPRGARITELPEAKTPLGPSHGLCVGDVIRSINGVAVNSKDEVLEYLRGPGRGKLTYVVGIETDGAEREIVYRVPRQFGAPRDRD